MNTHTTHDLKPDVWEALLPAIQDRGFQVLPEEQRRAKVLSVLSLIRAGRGLISETEQAIADALGKLEAEGRLKL